MQLWNITVGPCWSLSKSNATARFVTSPFNIDGSTDCMGMQAQMMFMVVTISMIMQAQMLHK